MGGFVVDYYLNTSSYSKNCENKAKPILKCNGKCQLAKKILEKQKQEEQTPEQKLENKYQVICFKSYFAILPSQNVDFSAGYPQYPVAVLPSVLVMGIFRPPCLV
ncbi:hypothetical protein [Flavitalea sp.]|nr:hypothetical protein [Flavitalea sp.]